MVFLILGLQLPGIISESLSVQKTIHWWTPDRCSLMSFGLPGVNGCAPGLALADASV